MRNFIYRFALLAALLGSGSIVLHAAHLDASHVQSGKSHDCGLCRAVTSTDFPVVQTHDPIFNLAYDLVLVVVSEITGRTFSSSHPRAPPID